MPSESKERVWFYIGGKNEAKQKEERVAWQVFRTRKLCVVHLMLKNNKWISHNKEYISSSERKHPPYRSFACVPILGPDDKEGTICLGVACFDSMNSKTFD